MKIMTRKSLKDEVLEAELTLLRNGGNKISSDHKEALAAITSLFVDSAFIETPSRWAIGLDTGLGKTTLLATFLNTMKANDIAYQALVCVPNQNAMQEFRQALLSGNFTQSEAGCKYSGNGLPFDSVNDADLDNYDVLIVCHARVDSSRGDWNKLVSNRTVFYDEALKRGTVTEGIYRSLKLDVQNLSDYLPEDLRERLNDLLTALEGADVDNIIPLNLPDDAAYVVDMAIKKFQKELRRKDDFKVLLPVVSGKYDALRNHNGNYFTFESTLPEMNNLFVLDANHSHSDLSKLDDTIQILETPKFKRFDEVSFKVASMSLSKSKITQNLERYVQWAKDLTTETSAVICYKDIADKFPQGTNVITWGMHAGANSFSNLDTLICVGLLTMPHAVTKGHMTLIQGDLSASTDGYQEINADEALLELYQAVSRGASRKVSVRDGVTYARPSTIYLSGKLTQPQIDLLKEVMPGCSYSLIKYDQHVSDIKQYFDEATFEDMFHEYISIKELRKNIPSFAALNKKSSVQAVVSRLLNEGFYKIDRGLVRNLRAKPQ